ncbi:hypothetical protein IJ384_07260 [bacterium]|nr:hypothetical protein [bacterium]
MKKFIIFIFTIFLFIQSATCEILKAGISVDHVPKTLFGTWRVNAKLDSTNAPKTFRPQSLDMWNLIRMDDKITLDNPFSGAKAEISVQTVEDNLIVFSKRLPYDGNKVLTDTVTIRLNKNEFSGINSLRLEYFSLIDNHLMKTETATYHIKGEKISGDNVLEIN